MFFLLFDTLTSFILLQENPKGKRISKQLYNRIIPELIAEGVGVVNSISAVVEGGGVVGRILKAPSQAGIGKSESQISEFDLLRSQPIELANDVMLLLLCIRALRQFLTS